MQATPQCLIRCPGIELILALHQYCKLHPTSRGPSQTEKDSVQDRTSLRLGLRYGALLKTGYVFDSFKETFARFMVTYSCVTMLSSRGHAQYPHIDSFKLQCSQVQKEAWFFHRQGPSKPAMPFS